jgi:hypothetical protein
MSKNINFKARSKTEFELQLKPYPAVKQLPKWFTEMEPYEQNNDFPELSKNIHLRNGTSNATFKKCVPLLDGMSSGYIIPLWADVIVEQQNNESIIFWRTRSDIFELHAESAKKIISPIGYDQKIYKYMNCWIPETPKGYSCLVISPLGHNDLPFKAVPAVVDTDKSTLELVFPMWIKTGFEGIVEKGTPLVQIIPFKRDDWTSTFDYYEDNYYKTVIEEKSFNSTIVSNYLKNHHSKKKFK